MSASEEDKKASFPAPPRRRMPLRAALLFGGNNRSLDDGGGGGDGRGEESRSWSFGGRRALVGGGGGGRERRRIVSLVPSPEGANQFCLVEGGGAGGQGAESTGEIMQHAIIYFLRYAVLIEIDFFHAFRQFFFVVDSVSVQHTHCTHLLFSFYASGDLSQSSGPHAPFGGVPATTSSSSWHWPPDRSRSHDRALLTRSLVFERTPAATSIRG